MSDAADKEWEDFFSATTEEDEWEPTAELRFVRRPVRFAGHAEPAFRLVLQQLWRARPVRDETVPTWDEWRDVPTVNEPDPIAMQQQIDVAAVKAA